MNEFSILKKILKFLNKPFPHEESWSEVLKLTTLIAVFVTLFLYIFKPFGMHTIKQNFVLICLAFGFITLSVSVIWEWLMLNVLKVKNRNGQFTFSRWLIYIFGGVMLISLANFLFVRWLLFGDIQWQLFPAMIRGTFAIGFFPIMILGVAALYRQERKYRQLAAEIDFKHHTTSNEPVSNIDDTQGLIIFDIAVKHIRYIEAMQNYVIIAHLNDHGSWQHQTVRTTMKVIAKKARDSNLVPCHRSYFVNRQHITAINGNAQGLLLSLDSSDKKIPVSRRYVSDFKVTR